MRAMVLSENYFKDTHIQLLLQNTFKSLMDSSRKVLAQWKDKSTHYTWSYMKGEDVKGND